MNAKENIYIYKGSFRDSEIGKKKQNFYISTNSRNLRKKISF